MKQSDIRRIAPRLHLNSGISPVNSPPFKKRGDIISVKRGQARMQGDARRKAGDKVGAFLSPRIAPQSYYGMLGTDPQALRDMPGNVEHLDAAAREARNLDRERGRLVCGKPLTPKQAERCATIMAREFGPKGKRG